jgi:DNA-3-methyladenine glycosylase
MLLRVLPRSFYDREPAEVARDLLGKLLVRRLETGTMLAGRIVEAEAYLGESDPAAHAYAGKTPRNAVLFGPPGHAYVYFIYGNHYCFNVSCMEEGFAGCVLLRALEPVAGIAEMTELRGVKLFSNGTGAAAPKPALMRKISSGPGRLAQALGITRALHNSTDLTSTRLSDLWIADDGCIPPQIQVTPRINVNKAVDWPLRFTVAGIGCVSGPKRL